MRTGIYVYSSTTLTFSASETVTLTSYANQHIAVGTSMAVTVGPGIYKAITNAAITVTATSTSDLDVIVVPNNKDPWPDPPHNAAVTLNANQANADGFFVIPDAKSAAF